MADELKVFALDEGANKHQTMTKEQIIAAIVQAVNNGTIGNIDTGFITKIQEINNKTNLKVWIGTNAEFTALPTKDTDTLYLFTDDPTIDDMEEAVTTVKEAISKLSKGLVDGTIETGKAVVSDTKGVVDGNLLKDTGWFGIVLGVGMPNTSLTFKIPKSLIKQISKSLINQNALHRFDLYLDLNIDNLSAGKLNASTSLANLAFIKSISVPLFIREDSGDLSVYFTNDNNGKFDYKIELENELLTTGDSNSTKEKVKIMALLDGSSETVDDGWNISISLKETSADGYYQKETFSNSTYAVQTNLIYPLFTANVTIKAFRVEASNIYAY